MAERNTGVEAQGQTEASKESTDKTRPIAGANGRSRFDPHLTPTDSQEKCKAGQVEKLGLA
jgi:hypothetical protein